jgi:hypothetical protein
MLTCLSDFWASEENYQWEAAFSIVSTVYEQGRDECVICVGRVWGASESIEWFMEGHAFSSFWLLPHPVPRRQSANCLSVFLCVAGRAHWRERGGAKPYDDEKALTFINHSTRSGVQGCAKSSKKIFGTASELSLLLSYFPDFNLNCPNYCYLIAVFKKSPSMTGGGWDIPQITYLHLPSNSPTCQPPTINSSNLDQFF